LWKLTHQLHAQGLNSVIPQPAIHICRSGNGTDDGRIHNVASPRSWFDPAVKKSGVQDFNWHALRHTFISRLVMNGVDLRTVQELAGHKSIAMTMRSAHLAPSHLDAAIEKTMSPTATNCHRARITVRFSASSCGVSRLREKQLGLVGAAGLEPATLGLEIRCSIRLSYAPVF